MPAANPDLYLARLKRLAREHGGVLLSAAYVNDVTPLRFRCREGHVFTLAPGRVHSGRWCQACAFAGAGERRKAPAIAKLKRIVARHGGKVVSGYLDSQTKQRYRCSEGHEWETVPSSVLRGTWCRKCATEKLKSLGPEERRRILRRLRTIARKRGGQVVSKEWVASSVPLLLRCAQGHEWKCLAQSLDRGAWCPRCRMEALFLRLKSIAERRGGRCLARSCTNASQRLEWECVEGHRWTAAAVTIKQGSWCRRCRNSQLDRLRELARERGGRCLSEEYFNGATLMRWSCDQGHGWLATANSITRGSWCRVCRRGWGKSRALLSIEIMREMAFERGGQCLSLRYHGIYTPLRWRCARGHVWVTPANNVRRGGWCPRCSHGSRGTLDALRDLAADRNGRLLSRTWNNHLEPLLFECARGHRFREHGNVVRSGVWCRRCRT